jgi:hypothetical protein
MKNILIIALLLLRQFCWAQEYPLTMTPGEGANVNLSLVGDELTISMTSRDFPANSAVYKLNICDINYVGGDMASYDYSYTKYYFLKVSFALKKGGRYQVIRSSSAPYSPERPLNYENAVDGNSVGVNEPCTEFDGNWKKINDASCNTIMVILQAFKDDVNRLYEWRNMLLKRLQACGSGKIVYKEFCFSCRDERFVHSNNAEFQPHLNDCDDRERSVPFDMQEEMNEFHYEILALKNHQAEVSKTYTSKSTATAASLEEMYEQAFTLYKQQNFVAAYEMFSIAAEKGHIQSQYFLGALYQSGIGVQQSFTEAAKWYRIAADKGSPGAQLNLGIMHANGLGIAKNLVEAEKLLRKAAANQSIPDAAWISSAQYWIGWVIEQSPDLTIGQAKAAAEPWYELAAERGNEEAKKALKRIRQ